MRTDLKLPRRIPELDGVRAIAILLVLVIHFKAQTGPLRWTNTISEIGWIGVDLFFVLSGYLISGILLDSVGTQHYYRDFIIRRALRILPLYYACLLLFSFAAYFHAEHWAGFFELGRPTLVCILLWEYPRHSDERLSSCGRLRAVLVAAG